MFGSVFNITCLFQLLSSGEFRQQHQVTREFIERLGLEKQLLAHEGCVNCVQWSDNGELLASGSDDLHVIVWDPFRGRVVRSLNTGHAGNIFSVKFMPRSGNNLVATGAAGTYFQRKQNLVYIDCLPCFVDHFRSQNPTT